MAKKQFLVLIFSYLSITAFSQDTLRVANVEAILYTGNNKNQLLGSYYKDITFLETNFKGKK